jgi:phosphonoacetate hydrolase
MVLLDGFDPRYVQLERMPALARLVAEGASTLAGTDVLPTLTNVNHVSAVTGTYPERHGLSTNYYFERGTGREVFMEDVAFVREKLIFEWARGAGLSTALVTAKAKLTRLLNRGLDHCVDMTHHPPELRAAVGAPPPVYSAEINLWVLRMARQTLRRVRPRLAYIATTDYMEHKYGPDEAPMQQQAADMDALLGEILGDGDLAETVVAVFADHGMNAKTRAVSPVRALAEAGIRARGLPLIRDGLYEHHRDLGGALYLYLDDPGASREALAILASTEGVEEVIPQAEAGRIHLPPERVGDLVAFAGPAHVFGIWAEGPVARDERDLRSHGSKHERTVPIVLGGAGVRRGARLEGARTIDLAPTVLHLLGVEAPGLQGRVLEEALA